MTKICNKCNETKSLNDFPPRNISKDGYRNTCRKCTNSAFNLRRKNNSDMYKDRDRRYYYNNREKKLEYIKQYSNINKHKMQAQHILRQAIKSDKIQKMPCIVCKDTKSEAHHPDYTKPLDIIWLCRSHHRQAHLI